MATNSLKKSASAISEAVYRAGVKEFCHFTARGGDLDRRFTPAPTGQQGIAGHSLIASRRGPGYRTEIALSAERGALCVRGRADGFLARDQRLEEYKTHRGAVDRIPDNHRVLHWAQLQTYGALLCEREGLSDLTLALVYFNIDEQHETVLEEAWSAEKLFETFERRCAAFSTWSEAEVAHRKRRDCSLRELEFPFGELHPQQRLLAEAVYRSAVRGNRLLAEAPTGVGKTLGTLFPLLKALAAQKIDKIFYLTAKSTGRALALDATAQLRRANPNMTLRVLDLVARDKACVQPGRECHGASCPLATGFYDRLAEARAAAVQLPVMDQAALREIAQAHGICPYYLGQEMIRWADVVIADYNHYFDVSAMLYALAQECEWEVGVLVDEAHNLVPRARDMYSATFDESVLRAAITEAPAPLRSALLQVRKRWSAFRADRPPSYCVVDELPGPLVSSLKDAVSAITDWTARQTDRLAASTQEFHFSALAFLRLAESLGSHSLLEWVPAPDDCAQLRIRNLVPASFLAPRIAAAKSVALFSATLSPREYYQDLLGLKEQCDWLQVGSPFDAAQLEVNVIVDVSTRFRDRARSMDGIVSLVARQFEKVRGNYLLFAGSYEYLRQVEERLRTVHPEIPLWAQRADMGEEERKTFADRFVEGGAGIGVAVLGGSFSEGIDLPGSRLIGAFVLTLGLPAIDPSNEETRKRFEQTCGRGYEYAYLYPGLQKVVQAAGRVIRSTQDRGFLFLLDDRYALPEIAQLLPAWWEIRLQGCPASPGARTRSG